MRACNSWLRSWLGRPQVDPGPDQQLWLSCSFYVLSVSFPCSACQVSFSSVSFFFFLLFFFFLSFPCVLGLRWPFLASLCLRAILRNRKVPSPLCWLMPPLFWCQICFGGRSPGKPDSRIGAGSGQRKTGCSVIFPTATSNLQVMAFGPLAFNRQGDNLRAQETCPRSGIKSVQRWKWTQSP